MSRNPNTDLNGNKFKSNIIEAIWNKAKIQESVNSNIWRKDSCGAWIKRNEYGNTESDFGWEIDHVIPVSKGGSDDLSNLQPLHWKNNRGKGDDWPNWKCTITAVK